LFDLFALELLGFFILIFFFFFFMVKVAVAILLGCGLLWAVKMETLLCEKSELLQTKGRLAKNIMIHTNVVMYILRQLIK